MTDNIVGWLIAAVLAACFPVLLVLLYTANHPNKQYEKGYGEGMEHGFMEGVMHCSFRAQFEEEAPVKGDG